MENKIASQIRQKIDQYKRENDCSLYEITRRAGLAYTNIRPFYAGDKNDMKISTLEALCKVIGSIELG